MGSFSVGRPQAALNAIRNLLLGGVGIPTVPTGILSRLVAPALTIDAPASQGGRILEVAFWGGIMSTIEIVAGEENLDKMNCWEQVLGLGGPQSPKIPNEKLDLYRQNGMPLQDLARYCEVLETGKDSSMAGAVALKNKASEYFALAISMKVPAGTTESGPNAKAEVLLVHAFKVEPKRK
ncbi:hypothetical protein CaCOL14_006514 [Colletotrichum acutatum]